MNEGLCFEISQLSFAINVCVTVSISQNPLQSWHMVIVHPLYQISTVFPLQTTAEVLFQSETNHVQKKHSWKTIFRQLSNCLYLLRGNMHLDEMKSIIFRPVSFNDVGITILEVVQNVSTNYMYIYRHYWLEYSIYFNLSGTSANTELHSYLAW